MSRQPAQASSRAQVAGASPSAITLTVVLVNPSLDPVAATGLNADASSAVGYPAVSLNAAGRLQIVFSRDAERAELGYAVEAAPALAGASATWSTIATSTGGAPFVAQAGATATGDGTLTTVTVHDASGFPRRFVRVRVSIPQ